MQDNPPKQLDTVALTEALPEHGLLRGQVGPVVDELAPGIFEVEFADTRDQTYQRLPLRAEQILVLRDDAAATP